MMSPLCGSDDVTKYLPPALLATLYEAGSCELLRNLKICANSQESHSLVLFPMMRTVRAKECGAGQKFSFSWTSKG